MYSVAFSPDGKLLAAGSADRSVYLWHLSSAGHASRDGAALTGPASYVYAVAFSPDGRTLAAGSADGTVRLWDTSPAAAAAGVCASAGDPITRQEWARFVPGVSFAAPCG